MAATRELPVTRIYQLERHAAVQLSAAGHLVRAGDEKPDGPVQLLGRVGQR